MKAYSKKRAKLERNRFSILTDNLDECYICGQLKDDLHEIFGGVSRYNSIRYGLVLPLCRRHHNMMDDRSFSLIYKKIAKNEFIKKYPNEDFVKIFHPKDSELW